MTHLLQVYAHETTFGDKKCDYCRFSFQSQKSRRGQSFNWSSEQRKRGRKRQRERQKQLRERGTASVGPQKANFHLEKHARSSITQTRKANGRDDLVHLLRQVHLTETRKVMEQVMMTEVIKAQQHILVKVCQGKANRPPFINLKIGSCQR